MYCEKYVNTDAEELLEELDRVECRAIEMFREFKQIKLQPAFAALYRKEHNHPLNELYVHGRLDTDDLYITLGEARFNCDSIGNFVDYIDKKITNPELRVFDDAYQYINAYGDNGTFRDMLNLYLEVMKLYKITRKNICKLNNTAAARLE
ncbi:MAG: hypothetical protein ACJA0H_000317 [Francisellaceae bacterium]|jgi:hypothetical protein